MYFLIPMTRAPGRLDEVDGGALGEGHHGLLPVGLTSHLAAAALGEPWRTRFLSGNRGSGTMGYWNPNGVNRFWYNSHGHSCTYNGQLNVEPPYDETTNYIVDDYPYDPCEGTTKFFVWSGSSYVCYPASMCSSALWHNVGFTQWQNDYDTDRGYGYYQQRELPYWDSTQEVFASE